MGSGTRGGSRLSRRPENPPRGSLRIPGVSLDLDIRAKAEAQGGGREPAWETLTDELEGLLEVLPQVLLVAVGGRQPLVAEQALLVVEERQVGGDVDDVADVQPPHGVQVLGVLFVAEVQEGQDGRQLGALDVGGGGGGLRGRAGGRRAAPRLPALLQLQGVVTEVFMVLLETAESAWKDSTAGKVRMPTPLPPEKVRVIADADFYG